MNEAQFADLPKDLTVKQVAILLGVSERRVRDYCRNGRLGRRHGDRIFLIPRDEFIKFALMQRKTGRPGKGQSIANGKQNLDDDVAVQAISQQVVNDEHWPKRNVRQPVEIEIHARFDRTRSWHNDDGQRYNNPSTAIFGPNGAVALFEEAPKVRLFLKRHGCCRFFAVAEAGRAFVFTTLDGQYLYRLERKLLGNRHLNQVSVEELASLSRLPGTPKRRIAEL